jgi:hypothetical protein
MLLQGATIDQNVVYVDDHKIIKPFAKNVIHESAKCDGCIGEPYLYDPGITSVMSWAVGYLTRENTQECRAVFAQCRVVFVDLFHFLLFFVTFLLFVIFVTYFLLLKGVRFVTFCYFFYWL